MLDIRALSFTREWVAHLVMTEEDSIIGVATSGHDAIVGVAFSLPIVCFGTDSVAVVSP